MTNRLVIALVVLSSISIAQTNPLKNPALNPVTVISNRQGAPLQLVRDGKAVATVVIPEQAMGRAPDDSSDNNPRYAAGEFVKNVKLATGADLPIVTDVNPPQGMLVLIGEGALAKKLGITVEGLPKEGFRVKAFTNGIAIVGNEVKFGVYDVLERFLGFRWYYPGADGTITPETTHFSIPQVHYTDAPVRHKRHMWPFEAKGLTDEECRALIGPYRVGTTEPGMTNSAFGFLAHYYEQYPEIFELGMDGKRNKMIPCFSNPKTLELTLKDLAGLYEKGDSSPFQTGIGNKHPWVDQHAIHIQPWDEELKCNCELCKKIVNSHQNPAWGSYSHVLGQFVADLAIEVQKRWPDKVIYYMPYVNYTAPPMDIKFPGNVYVQVCMMYGVGTQKEPAVMAAHDEWIDGWYKLTGHPVQLWEYELWPTLKMPFQYPHVIQRFQQKHRDGYVGSFINGLDGPTGLPGDQWAQFAPTLYCWFRLLWNPDFNVDAALSEYTKLMYGPAGRRMDMILKQLTDRWENVKWKEGYAYRGVALHQIYEETMPPSEIAKLKANLVIARNIVPHGSIYERRVNFFGTAIDRFIDEADTYKRSAIKSMNVVKVNSEPVIDGKLDDNCWSAVKPADFVMAMDASVPKVGATVQAAWNDNGICFGFKIAETHMDKLIANIPVGRNTSDIWMDDSMELYINTDGKRVSFRQFLANSLGALCDPTVTNPGEISNARTAAYRGDGFWSLEVYIPYNTLGMKTPTPDSIWTANFCRNRRTEGVHEIQRWNTQLNVAHADTSAFGPLKFVTKDMP